jgi:hypothetical protein
MRNRLVWFSATTTTTTQPHSTQTQQYKSEKTISEAQKHHSKPLEPVMGPYLSIFLGTLKG